VHLLVLLKLQNARINAKDVTLLFLVLLFVSRNQYFTCKNTLVLWYLEIYSYHCWSLPNQFVFAVNYFILRWISNSVGRNINYLALLSFSPLGFLVLIFVLVVSWADGRIQTLLEVTSHSCISKLNHWQNSLHLCFVRAFRRMWVQISERKPVIGMTKSFYSAFPDIFQTVLQIMWDMFPSTSLPIYYILVIYRCVPALANMRAQYSLTHII